jgi:hypothetical protein
MTVTPIRAARLSNARRMATEILTKRQCMYPEEAARLIIDELLNAGWSPPGAVDGDDVPQPSYSTPEGRARARALFEQARDEARGS